MAKRPVQRVSDLSTPRLSTEPRRRRTSVSRLRENRRSGSTGRNCKRNTPTMAAGWNTDRETGETPGLTRYDREGKFARTNSDVASQRGVILVFEKDQSE